MYKLMRALEEYRRDFNDYPPDNFPTNNGSEMIWYYLCREVGESHYGPYLKADSKSLAVVASERLSMFKFRSPLGGDYYYTLRTDTEGKCSTYLLVDPGSDKQLGGVLDREKGFIENDSGAAADNIYSSIPLSMYK